MLARSSTHCSADVQMATHIFNLHFQLLLTALLGSLEGKVLQEMGDAIVLGRFVSGTCINPNANSGSLAANNSLRGNS